MFKIRAMFYSSIFQGIFMALEYHISPNWKTEAREERPYGIANEE